MDALARNNVTVAGNPGGPAMLFVHGFGCDQNMWRSSSRPSRTSYSIVLMDHVGAGGSDLSAYDRSRYDSLDGYAQDVLEVCDALDLTDVVFVGHSVSAMVGVMAANREPGLFAGWS